MVSTAGRELLWIIPKTPLYICHGAGTTGNLVKQAAPGNVSTRVRFFGPQASQSRKAPLENIACGDFSGAACLTPFLAVLALERISRDL